jgi:hypothetical protein
MTLLTQTRKTDYFQSHTFGFDNRDATLSPTARNGWGKFVAWERTTSDSLWKTFVVFFTHLYIKAADETEAYEECRVYQENLAKVQQARPLIIKALGGQAVVRRIPVIELPRHETNNIIQVTDEFFPNKTNVVQGEDATGRKFVAFKTREGKIITFSQRFREVCISTVDSNDGRLWVDNTGRIKGAAQVAAAIKRLLTPPRIQPCRIC